MRKVFLLSVVSLFYLSGFTQSLPTLPLELQLLNFNGQLPDNLTSTRSIVLVDVPDSKSNFPTRGDWQSFALEAHPQLMQIGIDAVAYYNLKGFYAGIDVTKGYLAGIRPREIKNVLFLRKKEGVLGEEVELIITAKKADVNLIIANQSAYRIQRNALREIMLQLGRDAYRGKMVSTNFLIPDQPEFFTDTDVVRGRRYETFNSDLRIGKLAVPRFAFFQPPENFDTTQFSQDQKSLIKEYNREIGRNNDLLEQIMELYPYKYEIVDYSVGEDHLYRREFSYVLMFLHTTGRNIKELLNYQIDLNETDYITIKAGNGSTTLEQIPVNTPVYKFYMKQLVNKEIYLGKEWDADLSWEAALINHLNNFKEALEGKSN